MKEYKYTQPLIGMPESLVETGVSTNEKPRKIITLTNPLTDIQKSDLYSEVALANKTKERGKINKNDNGKFHSGGWVGFAVDQIEIVQLG